MPFEVLFDEDIVFGGVLDELLGSFRIEGSIGINVEGEISIVWDRLPGQIVCEESLILVLNVWALDLHIGAFINIIISIIIQTLQSQ